MVCEICSGDWFSLIYSGPVRDGNGKYIVSEVMACQTCHAWRLSDSQGLGNYEGATYRESLGELATAQGFMDLHDSEQVWKLFALGDHNIRGKDILDIGAAAGSFVDYVRGLAQSVDAVEPCHLYWTELERKCSHVYADLHQIQDRTYDLITCFDTVEHVQDPKKLLADAFQLLRKGGKILLSTPDRTELSEKRLKKKNYFRTQHKWYFDGLSIAHLLHDAGVRKAEYYSEDEPLGKQLYVWCVK